MSGGRALIGEAIDVNRAPGALQVPPTIVIHAGTEEEEASTDSTVSSGLTNSETQSAEDEAQHEDANDNIASATPPSASVTVVERTGLEPNIGSQVQIITVTGQTHQQSEVRAPAEQAPEQSETAVERQTHTNWIFPGGPQAPSTIHFLCTFTVFVVINIVALVFINIVIDIVKYYASAH